MEVDLKRAADAYAEFLRAIGLSDQVVDVSDSAVLATELMASRMCGVGGEPPHLSKMPAPGDAMVSLKSLPFYSFCGHHFVPFFGTVRIDYIPCKLIAGLGGFTRVIDHFSRMPQFQESLCTQIATHLNAELHPIALRVTIRARQMCLELQGKGSGIVVETVKVCGDVSALNRVM